MISGAPNTTGIYSNQLFCSPNYSTSVIDTESDWLCPKDEWKKWVNRHKPKPQSREPLINIDSSSIKKIRELETESSSIPYFFDRKTSYFKEIQLAKAMVNYDKIGMMPPKNKKKITLKIIKSSKGKLPDYEPEI